MTGVRNAKIVSRNDEFTLCVFILNRSWLRCRKNWRGAYNGVDAVGSFGVVALEALPVHN